MGVKENFVIDRSMYSKFYKLCSTIPILKAYEITKFVFKPDIESNLPVLNTYKACLLLNAQRYFSNIFFVKTFNQNKDISSKEISLRNFMERGLPTHST